MRTPRLLSRALRFALPLGALAVLAPVAGCDVYDNGGGDDTYGNVVNVVTFNFNLGDAEETNNALSFNSDDLRDSGARTAVADALTSDEVNNGLVLLYAEDDLILGFNGGDDRWSALPHTEAVEAVGTDDVPYVDYTVTYTYSYDIADLYFDVTSSAIVGEDGIDLAGLIAERTGSNNIRMRLVSIPGRLYTESGYSRADLQSYAAVRQAFSLAE